MTPHTDKADYWMNSIQRQRWVATSISGHRTGAEKDPGVLSSAGVASHTPSGAELALELRRKLTQRHHGRYVNFT